MIQAHHFVIRERFKERQLCTDTNSMVHKTKRGFRSWRDVDVLSEKGTHDQKFAGIPPFLWPIRFQFVSICRS
uniref:Uncharacterized protein n=1 Tax=Daphnia magna TaxID=35525 RepID=A0A0P6DVQ7_9CRUS